MKSMESYTIVHHNSIHKLYLTLFQGVVSTCSERHVRHNPLCYSTEFAPFVSPANLSLAKPNGPPPDRQRFGRLARS